MIDPGESMVADAHKDACRKVGAEGMVLLQNNENLLPIDFIKGKTYYCYW